jgi:hypothetical protein
MLSISVITSLAGLDKPTGEVGIDLPKAFCSNVVLEESARYARIMMSSILNLVAAFTA